MDGSFDADFLWNYLKEHPESVYCLPVKVTPPWDPTRSLDIRNKVMQCRKPQDFHKLCICRGYRSLNEMLNCFEVFLPLVRGNLHLIEQLSYDFCQRQWEQNVVYCEVRYSPHLLAEAFSNETPTGNDHGQAQDPPQPLDITPEAVFAAVTTVCILPLLIILLPQYIRANISPHARMQRSLRVFVGAVKDIQR